MAAAVGALGLFARRSGKVAFALIAHVLEPDERVDVLVQGRFRAEEGAAAVTDRRVVLANGREWNPDVESIALGPGLTVTGWQDDRAATLAFERHGERWVIDQIADGELARRMAGLVRARCGG